MTDPKTSEPTSPRDARPAGRTRNIPPLVWIVLALLVLWLVVALVQRGGSNRTPSGGTMPSQAEGPSYMPAAPANGSAPATPAGVINGPNQPATDNAPNPPR
jgi:hypothetical protein